DRPYCHARRSSGGARLGDRFVRIDATPALAAEAAFLYQLPQIGGRRIFFPAEIARENLHDRDAYVEADEVREAQWPDGVAHPERHDRVDVRCAPNTLAQREEGLVDHRHQTAVRDEAR